MSIIYIYITNKTDNKEIILTKKNNNKIKVRLNINNLTNYEINKELSKIKNILNIYNNIKKIKIIFDDNINYKLISKINDIIYNFYPSTTDTKIYYLDNDKYKINLNLQKYMDEITLYKNIVMAPNKNPDTFLNYVVSRIPGNYLHTILNINDSQLFPLTKGVGKGSSYNSYFVHIFPKIEKPGKNIYLVGKAVTFDSGGMNIKIRDMKDMKIDMTGAAMILSVLNLLENTNHNIHLLLPIVENMIGSTALRPGMVIRTMSNKLVEVVDTDAEGRLCLVDCFDYINMNLITDKDPNNCIIIDVATLTGNTTQITCGISSLSMCNDIGKPYLDNLINIGEEIGEFLDYLKIRNDYLELLKSEVGDIQSINKDIKADCVMAGTFLNYFINKDIPWIHLDFGSSTYIKSRPLSYGINLLYQFINSIKN